MYLYHVNTVWGAYMVGVLSVVLTMFLPPIYQAGLGIVMWIWCIWRYRRHLRRGPMASPGRDDGLDLLFRG